MPSETDPIFQRIDLTSGAPYPKMHYVKRLLWNVVQHTLFRYSGSRMMKFRVRLVRLFGGDIAMTANMRPTCLIRHPWLLTMGEWSTIADHVNVYNLGPISIGAHSVVSQHAHLCAGTHDYLKPDLPLLRPPITIGPGVWVCADAFIGPGVTIGANSMVGARSCVMRDVPPGVIVAGNPAKVIKDRPMNAPAAGPA
ncbi:colanic acid biosynthesis acetyltransferase WcaF [soil metagenome]